MQQCHRSAVRGLSHQRAEHRRGPGSRVAMADGALVAGLQRLAQRAQHVGLQKAADEGAPVAVGVVVVLQDGGGVGAHAAGHHHGGDVVPCVHVPLHQPAACLPGGRPREGVRRRPVRVPQVKQHDGWPRRQAERRAQPQLQHGLHLLRSVFRGHWLTKVVVDSVLPYQDVDPRGWQQRVHHDGAPQGGGRALRHVDRLQQRRRVREALSHEGAEEVQVGQVGFGLSLDMAAFGGGRPAGKGDGQRLAMHCPLLQLPLQAAGRRPPQPWIEHSAEIHLRVGERPASQLGL
mmetsp:Transcript_32371/g.83882  ORF Transcript_32371/g.83882 Transcript_32371/m.83882 type:complete len:290 (-) Transcript_32371:262-1131(-)